MTDRQIDHVALVVADLERSARLYTTLGFAERYRERIDDQGVDIVGRRYDNRAS